MTGQNNKIEKIKTCIIVVLTLSTILLLYFFWWNISFDDIKFPEETPTSAVLNVKAVTWPEKIIVRFDSGGSCCVVPQSEHQIWYSKDNNSPNLINGVKEFAKGENILIEEITKKQYDEIMNYASIEARLGYDIPFLDFCNEYGIKRAQSFEGIEYMSTLGYSTGSPESLFVYDGRNNKYYRLIKDGKVDKNNEFETLIQYVQSRGYTGYYSLGMALGIENKTLIPLDNMKTQLREFAAKPEYNVDQTDKISQIAETFFGESFDFIRKITEENGTIIYMYGYGEKTLIFYPDGTIEYKGELKDENYVSQQYFEALNTALQFVAAHGSWLSFEGTEIKPYVKKVKYITGKKKGYRFTFGMKAAGGTVYYESGDPIEIEVIGGQVTFYKRDVINYEKKSHGGEGEWRDPFSAINMVAQNFTENFSYVQSVLQKEGFDLSAKEGEEIRFEDIAKHITDVNMGYLRVKDKSDLNYRLRPVWIVSVEGVNLYFDLFKATPISYSDEGEN